MIKVAYLLVLAFVLPSIALASQTERFPTHPNLAVTPGSLCNHPDNYRYPEHIPYCSRNVDSDLKRAIIRDYDQQFGHSIGSMPRNDFKIDHLIPLCAGGSNERGNLWPQHKSVYNLTDPMEPLICLKMSEGKLKQRDAIEYIKAGKLDLSKIPAIMKKLSAL